MLELKGKYNTAKVFTDNIDTETISQVINLCNQKAMAAWYFTLLTVGSL